jgi:hypothetical protein
MFRTEPDRPPQVKPDSKPPVKRVAKIKRVAKRVAKYIHPTDKWIALRTKMREARLREEGLVRAKMADFMQKGLPTHTAEHPSKYVVEQESDTHVDVLVAVTQKRESRDDDAESIDLRWLAHYF